jgi:hypothetical protein
MQHLQTIRTHPHQRGNIQRLEVNLLATICLLLLIAVILAIFDDAT